MARLLLHWDPVFQFIMHSLFFLRFFSCACTLFSETETHFIVPYRCVGSAPVVLCSIHTSSRMKPELAEEIVRCVTINLLCEFGWLCVRACCVFCCAVSHSHESKRVGQFSLAELA